MAVPEAAVWPVLGTEDHGRSVSGAVFAEAACPEGPGLDVRWDHFGRMIIVCDEEAFARLRDRLGMEPAIAESLAQRAASGEVRSILVLSESVQFAPSGQGSRPYEFVPCILAGLISSAALIVGYVTIIRWIIWQLT
jgi:hypothetical protein